MKLQRLLSREEAKSILESFAAFMPDAGLALVGEDLSVVATAGRWAAEDLTQLAVTTGGVLRDRAGANPAATGPVQENDARYYPLSAGSRILGALAVRNRGSLREGEAAERALHRTLSTLLSLGIEKRELAAEALDTYRSVSLLYRVSETLGRSLDPQAISTMVLEQSRFIKADASLLLLANDDGTDAVRASFGDPREIAALHEAVRGLGALLRESREPAILSDIAGFRGTIVWVPLQTPERIHGGFALGRGPDQPVFTAEDEKLLVAFAGPSASALQNARLFEQVERHRREERRLLDLTSAVASELALDALLAKIINTSSDLLEAERSTLFIYDAKSNELWSRVAEGLETKEIRIPSSAGLAGRCFTLGEVINIRDAYEDGRFNQAVDRRTGFRTRSILCVPVVSKEGRKLGVIQVLNKKLGPFDAHDERFLRAFTAQAAIALENAQLFEDVLNERNYNESILKSLSNGVITLDVDAKVAKVNDAARRILSWRDPDVVGRPVMELFLHQRNHWVLQSLDNVGRTGTVDITMDADVTTETGDPVSVNMTAVPLVDVKGDAIGRMMVIEDVSREKRVKSAMSRYMTKELVDRVLEAGEERLGGSSQIATILFSDIRKFTGISEALGARGTVSMLNDYFTDMVDVLFSHGGILDKYIGDAIMAVFGVPFPTEQDADKAVLVATEMITALGKLNAQRRALGAQEIHIGVGVNTGEVISGNIGSPKRMDYTVIGDTVNLASRLESATKYFGVDFLFSEFTAKRLNCKIRCRELDLITVKGKSKPVAVFEGLDHHTAETFSNMGEAVSAFENGLKLYRAREWKSAIARFRETLGHHPSDVPAKLYVERCEYYSAHPPPSDWDGAWIMEMK